MVTIFLLIIGLVIGSFLGALTYRYPRNVSILKGRSVCDDCGLKLNWYDNIPVISYILLGGKCRSCKKTVSVRYPVIESISALSFYLIGPNIYAIALFCIFFSILIIDWEHQIIPDGFIFAGLTIVLIYLIFTNSPIIFASLFAGFLISFLLLLIFLFTLGRGMGLGDVKFAVLGGLVVGLKLSLVWLFLAFLTGGIAGIILILTGKSKLKSKIAFGPFLVLAIPLSIIWGESVIKFIGLG